MHMVDFEYNGTRLSDFGLKMFSINGIEDIVDISNKITINHVKAPNATKYLMTSSEYDETFSVNFQVCKVTCDSIGEDSLSDAEINYIARWLNRKRYYKFRPIYDDGSFINVYYYGTFNIQLIKFGEAVIGLDLTLNTNAPYGFIDEIKYKCSLPNTSAKFTMSDNSDEIGYLYCDATIKCLGGGDLTIKNELDPDNTIIIKNCSGNEIITMHGDSKIIQSSLSTHKTLPNDFNYNYLRIINTADKNKNVFSSNIPCEMTFSYSPIRKVGIVI